MRRLAYYLFAIFTSIYTTDSWSLDKNGNFESIKERDEYIAITLRKLVKQMNDQAPFMVDEETRFTSAVALEKTVNASYKLINFSSEEVDVNVLNRQAWKHKNDIACKDKATRILIDAGVSFVYLFYGNDGRLITRVVVDEYKCS